jgi:hypothetical protein
MPALVRLLASVGTFVDSERASLYEAFPTVGKVAIVRSLVSVDPVVPCEIRFTIESLLRHGGELAESDVSAVSAEPGGCGSATA